MDVSYVFLFGAFSSLIVGLIKLICAIRLKKKYEYVLGRVKYLVSQNNSRMFILEDLVTEGFDESLVREVIEEVFEENSF
jgi:hypothetical protein